MPNTNLWSILGKITILIWALVCLVIFMYFPGAISQVQDATLYELHTLPEKLSRISIPKYALDTLIAFLGMTIYGASCVSLGMAISEIFHFDEIIKKNNLLRKHVFVPSCFLIGNAAFSIIFLSIASLLRLTVVHSVVILSIGLLSGFSKIKKLPAPTIYLGNGFEKVIIALSITILGISLLQSSARLSYDASSMYFSIAKLSALKQHAEYYLEKGFNVSAFHSVIQASAIIQVFGDQSARMVSWLFGVVNISLALALAEFVGTVTLARRILPILILTSTAFLDLIGDGKVDLISSAYCLAAVYWMAIKVVDQRQSRIFFLLSGFFVGFACILRPHNAFLLGIFITTYLLQKIKTGKLSLSRAAKHAAWMSLGAVGFVLYHFLINKIIFGSPFAFWSVMTDLNPTNGAWDFKPETIWMRRLFYPFVITFKNSGASLGNITPLFLTFLPLLADRNIWRRIQFHQEAAQIGTSAVLTLLLWIITIFTVVEVRYVMFLWIILFIFIAEIAAKTLEAASIILRNLVATSMLVLLSFIIVRSIYISFSTYSPIDDQGNPQCYDSAFCLPIREINERANRGERVLMLSAFRYYLRTDLFTCSTNHEEYDVIRDISVQNSERFWLEIYRRGYKYIVYEYGYSRLNIKLEITPDPENTPDWIELTPIYGVPGDLQVAYKINIKKPPTMLDTICVRNPLGIWELQPINLDDSYIKVAPVN